MGAGFLDTSCAEVSVDYVFTATKRDALSLSDGIDIVKPGKDAELLRNRNPNCVDNGWVFSVRTREGVPVVHKNLYVNAADVGQREDWPQTAFAWFGWLIEPIPPGDGNRRKEWKPEEGWRAFPPERIPLPDPKRDRLAGPHLADLLEAMWLVEEKPFDKADDAQG